MASVIGNNIRRIISSIVATENIDIRNQNRIFRSSIHRNQKRENDAASIIAVKSNHQTKPVSAWQRNQTILCINIYSVLSKLNIERRGVVAAGPRLQPHI